MSGSRPSLFGLPARLFAFRRRRRAAAVLGMLVMAFNLWGVALLPAAMAMPAADTVSVCTGAGMVDIPLDRAGPHGPPAHAGGLCAFCLPMMHGGAGTASDVVLLGAPLGFVVPARLSGLGHLVPASAPSTALNAPRAPPSFPL